MDVQRMMMITTLLKVLDGEPLSQADAERFIMFLKTRPLTLSIPSAEEQTNLKGAFVETISNLIQQN